MKRLSGRWLGILMISGLIMGCNEPFQITLPETAGAPGNNDMENAPSLQVLTPGPLALDVGATVLLQGVCESGVNVVISENSNFSQVACSARTFATTLTLTSIDGPVAVSLSQTNFDGLQTLVSLNLRKDIMAPLVAITSPAVSSTVTGSATLSGSCESGLNVQISGAGLTAPVMGSCVNDQFSLVGVFTASIGNKAVTVQQIDRAGNVGSDSRSFTRAAVVGPSVAFTSPAANTRFQNTLNVAGTCQNGLAVNFSGADVVASATTCSGGSFSATVSFTSGDGAKNLILSQTNAQNEVGATSRTFVRDTTAPVITIASPGSGGSGETGLTLIGACEPGLTVTASGAGARQTATEPCVDGVYAVDVLFTDNDGEKTLQVSQTDAAGNVGMHSRSFQRASPPPDGAVLYAQNCLACHGALSVSAKLDRSAAQIANAIAAIPTMNGLNILSPAEITAIALALKTAH